MSEFEEIREQLQEAKNKLTLLELEEKSITSDAYFYQKNNDLDKLNELSDKQEELSKQIDDQKILIDELQSSFNSIKSQEDVEEEKKQKLKEEQEKIALEKKKEEERKQKEIEENERKKHEEESKEDKNVDYQGKEKFIKPEEKEYNNKHKKQSNRCSSCGAEIDRSVKFCPKCGNQLIIYPGGQNSGNRFVRLLLKKKKDDGSYRFSISKILGTVYAATEFFSALGNFYFPESIIIGIIAAFIGYLIFLACGYLVRWAYNKYFK